MAQAELEVKEQRYLREPRVVFVKELDEDHFLVFDLNHDNPYEISKEVFKREYVEI